MAHEKPERTVARDAKDYHVRHPAKKEEGENAATQEERAASPRQRFERFVDWYNTHKKVSLPITIGLFLALLFVVPVTRYAALGLFVKQDFSIVVVDSLSGKPVSSALVQLGGKSANTDAEGKASLRVPVGQSTLAISKTYYENANRQVVVPVGKQDSPLSVKLVATGRPIPVTVLNSVTRKPVVGATISALDSQAKTDDKGQTVLVVPAGTSAQVAATISADGYNKTDFAVKPTVEEDEANTFKLKHAGKMYFLSDQNGVIDVVRSDLDGQNRETVLAGTGKESKGETVLLATRDWKYLALQSRRDGGESPKLFLINTADGSLTTMDEGDANFTLSGWEGHNFVYVVNRTKVQEWEPKKQALKAYNADDKKLKTIDQTVAEGSSVYDYRKEYISNAYIVAGKIVYSKLWYGPYWVVNGSGKQAGLNIVGVDGSGKQVIQSFDTPDDIEIRPYNANELYVRAADKFFEYESGKLKSLPDMDSRKFYELEYATYLLSPSGSQTFWSQVRDGKKALLIGNASGKEEKRVATLDTEYQTYGWFTDDYLLVSKKGSELFIMPANGVDNESQLLKVTDYYRPYYNYFGYGGGYGGL